MILQITHAHRISVSHRDGSSTDVLVPRLLVAPGSEYMYTRYLCLNGSGGAGLRAGGGVSAGRVREITDCLTEGGGSCPWLSFGGGGGGGRP